jgi:hypothetical protein
MIYFLIFNFIQEISSSPNYDVQKEQKIIIFFETGLINKK